MGVRDVAIGVFFGNVAAAALVGAIVYAIMNEPMRPILIVGAVVCAGFGYALFSNLKPVDDRGKP